MCSARRLHAHVHALSTNKSQLVAPHMPNSFGNLIGSPNEDRLRTFHHNLRHGFQTKLTSLHKNKVEPTVLAAVCQIKQKNKMPSTRFRWCKHEFLLSRSVYAHILGTYFLTFCLTYLLTFFLTYLLTFFLTSFWRIFCHSFWQIFWHSFWWHIFWHIFLTYLSPFFLTYLLTGSRLRSGMPHWTHKIVVEVRHATLNSQDRGWDPTRRRTTGGGGGGRRSTGGEGEETNIKSNNPHLTGGEIENLAPFPTLPGALQGCCVVFQSNTCLPTENETFDHLDWITPRVSGT